MCTCVYFKQQVGERNKKLVGVDNSGENTRPRCGG